MAQQRKLGRPTDQRRAMLRNLTTSFLENGRIETTTTRAKEVKRMAEKMITPRQKKHTSHKETGTFLYNKKRGRFEVV